MLFTAGPEALWEAMNILAHHGLLGLPMEPGSRGQASEKDRVGQACGPNSQSQETKGTESFQKFPKEKHCVLQNILERVCPVGWRKIIFFFIFYF